MWQYKNRTQQTRDSTLYTAPVVYTHTRATVHTRHASHRSSSQSWTLTSHVTFKQIKFQFNSIETNQISIQFNHKNTTHVWQTETGAQGHINSQARGRTLSSASTRDYASKTVKTARDCGLCVQLQHADARVRKSITTSTLFGRPWPCRMSEHEANSAWYARASPPGLSLTRRAPTAQPRCRKQPGQAQARMAKGHSEDMAMQRAPAHTLWRWGSLGLAATRAEPR